MTLPLPDRRLPAAEPRQPAHRRHAERGHPQGTVEPRDGRPEVRLRRLQAREVERFIVIRATTVFILDMDLQVISNASMYKMLGMDFCIRRECFIILFFYF